MRSPPVAAEASFICYTDAMSIPYDPEHITYFGETDFRNQKTRFGIKSRDRTRHMYVIGKSGVGKSTLLENMAIQDIIHGEGVAVLDPHGSFAEKMLEYVPEHRIKDVVYFAPFDTDYPISFNVLEDVGHDKRHLVSSGLMSSFKKIWVDAWSARMEYILNNILLALLEYPDATLLGVNRMLADKEFRKKVVENISDPSVKSFWTDEFAKYGERYMQEAGAAIQNKIGQLTANPLVRNIIGQSHSSFDIRTLMDEQKILIINLSKGRIGEQNTSLLGSMLITKIYLSAMSRAEVSPDRMKGLANFYFYVDEFQSFANETFADILAEARKYKLALIIAHQYVAQMEEKVRDAVFGNVGTTVSFRVGPLDAELLEKVFAPQFTQNDLINLGMAEIYLSLMINDIGSPPFSARTLPPIARPTVNFKNDVVEWSRKTYARPKESVESNIGDWYVKDAPTEEEFPKKKIRFAPDGAPSYQAPRTQFSGAQRPQSNHQPFKKVFTERPPASLTASPPPSAPVPAPVSAQSPKTPATPVEITQEPKPSPALSSLLNSLDFEKEEKKESPSTIADEQQSPAPSSQNISPMKKMPGEPFEGEKPFRESVMPVKYTERGPSEQNKALLRSALEKAGTVGAKTPVPPPAPARPAEKTTPHTPSSPEVDKKTPDGEVSPDALKKIFE